MSADWVVFCRLSPLQISVYKAVLGHPDMQAVLHTNIHMCIHTHTQIQREQRRERERDGQTDRDRQTDREKEITEEKAREKQEGQRERD